MIDSEVMISVPYGDGMQHCRIPEKNFSGSLCPQVVAHGEPFQIIRNAISHSSGSCSFEQLVKSKKLLVLVNDASRATPTGKVLDVMSQITSMETWTFLVATGSHQSSTEEELRSIFGRHYEKLQPRIFCHDSRKLPELIHMGTTSFGNSVLLNHQITKADGIITIGSVEPHYFAGFTGGRKVFLPGIAGLESITRNHQLALKPGVAPLALKGNPVHEEMDDVLDFIKIPVFSIQIVADSENHVLFASAGNMRQSFQSAVEFCHSVYTVESPGKADIVVAVATPPLDSSLYQAHKAIENTRGILKDGGILILVAPCKKGIGDNPGFVDILSQAASPAQAREMVRNDYILGYHKVARLAELMEKAELWTVSHLNETLLENIFFKGFGSLQQAVDKALALKPDGKLIVVQNAGMTVPVAK